MDDDDDNDFDLEAAQEDDEGVPAENAANVLLQIIRGAQADDAEGGGNAREVMGTPTSSGPQRARRVLTSRLVARQDILRLFTQAGGLRRFVINDDDQDEEHARGYGSLRAGRRAKLSNQFPAVPSEAGRALMESGTFGTNEREDGQVRFATRKKLAARIMRRELGLEAPGKQRSTNRLAAQSLLPSSKADLIIHYSNRCYSGQFSDDGNFFFSCAQDFRVRMYDTSNPYDWKYYKTVVYPYGQWTITDASLSPDNRFLAYSSIKTLVCLAATDPHEDSDPYLLDFGHSSRRSSHFSGGHFGIWSVRFSGDGRELVAGASDHAVYVYDIERRQSILRIPAHEDDVNAVCFGDKSSPHLLYSGSDDTTIKVWDRRSMSDERPAGVFLGHTEGLTYIDSKGDGRYVLSNGKDQTMKLWDLRRMMTSDRADTIEFSDYSTGFDYRFQPYNTAVYKRHPHDSSVVTFRGHRVLKTLIRCHFSPPGSTDSRYVYSGSEDGSVYVYNMDATLAGKVDVNVATSQRRERGHDRAVSGSSHGSNGEEDSDNEDPGFDMWDQTRRTTWKTCVRDAAWHPHAPVLAATSWNGFGMTQGTCSVHSWNDAMDDDECDSPAMGQRVDAYLQPSRGYRAEGDDSRPSTRRRAAAARGRGRGYDM